MTAQPSNERFIETAIAIGDTLVQKAFWHDGKCNWVGHVLEEMDERTWVITPTVAALDADLYCGSAGVGLYLAELFRYSRDETHRQAAIAALRRSLEHAPEPTPYGFGYFNGALGIAYAAGRGGAVLGDAALCDAGCALAQRAMDVVATASEPFLPLDIISGCAGGVLALLGLATLPGGALFTRAALRLGEHLLSRAEVQDGRWLFHETSWPATTDIDAEASPPLTGFSHGAAGIALALLELARATGRSEFVTAAQGALAYENSWFDAAHQNWPDLRPPTPGIPYEQGAGFGLSWCHGAPGSGLTRVRALALADELRLPLQDRQQYQVDLAAALHSTRATLAERTWPARTDATLCHGAAGVAELLLVAGESLGDPACRDQARAFGTALVEEYRSQGSWLNGVASGGPNPSLMLGSAGIGYFLLRLCDPTEVPAVLLAPGVSS